MKKSTNFKKENRLTSIRNVLIIALLGMLIGLEIELLVVKMVFGYGSLLTSLVIFAIAVPWIIYEIVCVAKNRIE